MKAVQINQYGGPDVLEVKENIPTPSPKNGQILVKVHAASINPVDWKIREGYLKDYFPLQFPVTLGGDFAGVVTEIGEGVIDLKSGDEVYGQASAFKNRGSGSFAEFTVATVASIAKKPKTLNFEEAAALVLVGVSALQGLVEHINLQKGQKILIHGGAGGIGSAAVQLAKAMGAYVVTTVGNQNIDFAKQLGADEVIDYKNEHFERKLKDFDAVFDTAGGETTDKSFLVLKKGGILVSMAGQPNQELAAKYGVTALSQNTKTTTDHLNRLSGLVNGGKIKVQVDKVFPLDQIKEAFIHLETGHPQGKVVISL